MIRVILNREHLAGVLAEALTTCRRRLFIATADVKDVHIPRGGAAGRRTREAVSAFEIFGELAERGVEIHLLHGGLPSGPFMERLKGGLPATMTMRRCPRVHAKAVIVDGRRMYLGSANFTGAGLGAKSPRRRNFEAGIWTDEISLIDPVADTLQEIWSGAHCDDCGRTEHCPVPLEQPCL